MSAPSKDIAPFELARQVLAGRWPVLLVAAGLAAVVSGCRGALVILVKSVLDRLEAGGGSTALLPLAGLAVLLFVVQGGARVGRLLATRGAALRAEADLRQRLFAHLLGRNPSDLQQDGVGESLSGLSHDVVAIRTAVGAAVTVVQRPLTAAAVGGAAFWLAPRLALVGLVVGPLVVAVIAWSGRRTRHATATHLARLATVEAEAHDDLLGLRTLQAYGAEPEAIARYESADEEQVEAALRRTLYQALGPPLVEIAASVALGAVVVVGAAEVAAGSLSSGSLMAFLVAVALLHEPLKGIAVAHGLWEQSQAGLTRVAAALGRPVGVSDQPGARTFEGRPTTIELRSLCVDRGRGPILAGVDLRLTPGRVVVVQGETGAGKTTLVDALARFVAPSAGRILWNGVRVDELTVSSVRAHVALVDQSPWLGRGTIADAVRLGCPGASDGDVAAALEAAGLAAAGKLLDRLPGGQNGRIGDGGGTVSGGERRRIALARALLRDAPVLLMDEPTSGLDPDTEERFLTTVRRIAAGRIVLIVAHRAACAEIADDLLRLEAGKLHVLRRRDGARCA